jgi:hypothetical protein
MLVIFSVMFSLLLNFYRYEIWFDISNNFLFIKKLFLTYSKISTIVDYQYIEKITPPALIHYNMARKQKTEFYLGISINKEINTWKNITDKKKLYIFSIDANGEFLKKNYHSWLEEIKIIV